MKKYYFTSESVTEGHPDKLCDYISDSILDECLKQDDNSRVAVETFVSANTVTIAGQITSTARLKIGELVREKIKEVGFDDEIDTAGSMMETVRVLKEFGADAVYAACTHGVLSGPAIERIEKSPIKELVITNTIPLSLTFLAIPSTNFL